MNRLLSLAAPRQTLLTSAAFDLARRGAAREDREIEALGWLAHGDYLFPGIPQRLVAYHVPTIELFQPGGHQEPPDLI